MRSAVLVVGVLLAGCGGSGVRSTDGSGAVGGPADAGSGAVGGPADAGSGAGSGAADAGSGAADAGATARAALRLELGGQGWVTSSPAGLDCGQTCSASFDPGTQVTLLAQAAPGWHLDRWGGACSGAATCALALVSDTTVSATFAPDAPPPARQHRLVVDLPGSGKGQVGSSPAGLDCPSSCSAAFDDGTLVQLTATASTGSLFDHWTGACSGSAGCAVTLTADLQAAAVFVLAPTPAFSVEELPQIDGVVPQPRSMNNGGDIVGSYRRQVQPGLSAFLYDGATRSIRRILDHGDHSDQAAAAINDARQVAGFVNVSGVRWESGRETDLGKLRSTDPDTEPWAINQAGKVAGTALADDNNLKAFLWDGALHDLGPADKRRGIAFGINDRDIVVGLVGELPAVIEGGVTRSLGSRFGSARAINNAGRIVGVTAVDDAHSHAFVYDLPSGPLRDVSPASAVLCELNAVNKEGVAVGFCEAHAVILRGATVEPLDGVIGDASWEFIDARAINDRGQIAGVGRHGGVQRAFLITPR